MIRNNYYQQVRDDDPILYLRIDDAPDQTVARDVSGNAYHGTYVGGPLLSFANGTLADLNTAAAFDGFNDRIDVGNIAALSFTGPFSIGAIVETKDPEQSPIIGKSNWSTHAGYSLGINAAGNAQAIIDGNALLSSVVVADDVYHVLVFTYDNTNMRIYVDGVLRGTLAANPPAANSMPFMIGAQDNGSGVATAFIEGTIDEVFATAYALTAAQVAAQYAAVKFGPTGQSAQTFARAGVMRSGTSRAGAYNETFPISIGGVNRTPTRQLVNGSLTVRLALNEEPDTAEMIVFGFTPHEWMTVAVDSGAVGSNPIFGGSVQKVTRLSSKRDGLDQYFLECTDWGRQFNKYEVNGRYTFQSASLIAIDIVQKYCPGFSTVGIETGAPSIDEIEFTDEKPQRALTRLANRVGWQTFIDAAKVARFFQRLVLQNPSEINPANYQYENLSHTADSNQKRTRVFVHGGGGSATADVVAGSVSIHVDDASWYAATGGAIKVGSQILTYTGRTFDAGVTGPGTITGIPAGQIAYRIPIGAKAQIRVQRDNLAEQARLIALGDTDGIYVNTLIDERLSIDGGTGLGDAELAMFSESGIAASYNSRDRFAFPGREQGFNLPARSLYATLPIRVVVVRIGGLGYEREVIAQSDAPVLSFEEIISQ